MHSTGDRKLQNIKYYNELLFFNNYINLMNINESVLIQWLAGRFGGELAGWVTGWLTCWLAL